MKKLFALLLSLVMVFSAASAMALTLGIVTPDADHGFTGESVAHAVAEAEALKAAGVIEDYYHVKGAEASKQIEGIDTMLNQGVDAIMLWPLEGDQLRNAAQTIVDEEIPLIIYDRLIENFVGMEAEVMGDNVKIGNMMGEYLLKYWEEDLKAGKTITYLLFIGDSSTVSKQRTEGMTDILNASEYASQFVLLQDGFQTDWSNAKSKELMENWLSTADAATIADLDMIVTHDDEIIDGLMTVIPEEAGLESLKILTSVGGRRETLATFETVEKPELLTYFFSPSYIREAIRLTVAAAQGEETYNGWTIGDGQYLIPTIEIDKNTVEAYKNSVEFADRYSI